MDNVIERLKGIETELESLKGIITEKTDLERADDEYTDILPAMREYFRLKQHYRQGKASQGEVNHCLEKLVNEINEFLTVLHSNTTCPAEREILKRIKGE